tara:strand:+ start:713 stop:973 length:261 start_codon:yes stop_codon:yes gene_type:complete
MNYSINIETLTRDATHAILKLDRNFTGTSDYMGVSYFWAHEYRHTGLRDTSTAKRRRVHTAFLKAGLGVSEASPKHEEIIRGIINE